jgi:hypothetical protein
MPGCDAGRREKHAFVWMPRTGYCGNARLAVFGKATGSRTASVTSPAATSRRIASLRFGQSGCIRRQPSTARSSSPDMTRATGSFLTIFCTFRTYRLHGGEMSKTILYQNYINFNKFLR